MSRPKSSLKALELRKASLLAEAEGLRTQLSKDIDVVHQGLAAWRAQAKSVASYVSIAVAVIAGFSALRRMRTTGLNGKSSLFSKIFSGARTAATLWTTLHSRQS